MEEYARWIDQQHVLATSAVSSPALAQRLIALFVQLGEGIADVQPQLVAAVEGIGDGFSGLCIPSAAPISAMSLELLDALCAVGVVWDLEHFESGRESFHYTWYRWVHELPDDRVPHQRPLIHVRHNPQLRPWLFAALATLELPRVVDQLLAHEGTKAFLVEFLLWMAGQRERLQGSIPGLARLVSTQLPALALPQLAALAPSAMARIFRFDASHELATAVRYGTAAELTWPLFEDSVARLSQGRRVIPGVCESWPAMGVACLGRVEIVNGNWVVARDEIPYSLEQFHAIRLVDDHISVCYEFSERFGVCWLPWQEHEFRGRQPVPQQRYSLPVPHGRLVGAGLLGWGDLGLWHAGGQVLAAGDVALVPQENHYAVWDTRLGCQAANITSDNPREILEYLGLWQWVTSALGAGYQWQGVRFCAADSTVIPVYAETVESLLGRVGQRHIAVVLDGPKGRHIVSPFGVFSSRFPVCAVVVRPGGGYWYTDGKTLFDATADVPLPAPYTATGVKLCIGSTLPLAGWHQLRPRDVQASIRMREFTQTQAAEVLATLAPDTSRQVGFVEFSHAQWWLYQDPDLMETTTTNVTAQAGVVAKIQDALGTTDEVLAVAIAHMAADIAVIEEKFHQLRKQAGFATGQD